MNVTGIFTAIVIGLIIGALARLILPGKQSIPIWLTILCGIGGVLSGWFIYSAFGGDGSRGIDWIRWLIAIAVALSLLTPPSGEAQAPSPRATMPVREVCRPVDIPFPRTSVRIDRQNAATAVLDRQWARDTLRLRRDLTTLMQRYTALSTYATRNITACTGRSCICPRSGKGAVTLSQTLDPALANDAATALARLFRQDSASTFAGVMTFLREKPTLVRALTAATRRNAAVAQPAAVTRPRP